MTKKQWLELRLRMPEEIDRAKVEKKLRKYYEKRGWPQFEYIVFHETTAHMSMYSDVEDHYSYYSRPRTRGTITRIGKRRMASEVEDMAILAEWRDDPLHVIYPNQIHAAYLGRRYSGKFQDQLKGLMKDLVDFSPHPTTPHVLLKPIKVSLNAEGQLHCEDGPAIIWRNGSRHWWFNGVEASQRFIEKPPTLGYIKRELNQERKRILIERYGHEKYLKDIKAKLVQQDDYGKLWRVESHAWREEDLVMVEVVNSTPEPNGEFRKFFLRVPSAMTTAKEAVAWTFGRDASNYKVVEQT